MADKLTEQRLSDLQLLRGIFEKSASEVKQGKGVGIAMLVIGIGVATIPFFQSRSDGWTEQHWACIAISLAAIALGLYTLKNVGGRLKFTEEGIVEERANGKTGTVVNYADIKKISHIATRTGGEFLLIVTTKVRMSIVLTPEIFEAIESAKATS